MFCKNCGKDIGDAKFCQHCGNSNESIPKITVEVSQKDFFAVVKDKIKQIGQGKLLKVISIIAAIVNIVIRVVNNEIEVVYYALAQDDFFVLSEEGRKYMIIVIALQSVLALFLHSNARKENVIIPNSSRVIFVVSLIIQVLAMVLRLPAPY